MSTHDNENTPQYRGDTYGSAGTSLGSDAAKARFGDTTRAGAQGERYLGNLLKRNPTTSKYATWQSLRIPSQGRQKRYSSDVDFALASGKTLILVDCKMWSAGKVYWTAGSKVMKGLSTMKDKNGNPTKLSRNMELAKQRYADQLPSHRVEAITVFVPTRGGLPTSVGLLRFPGGVRSFLPQDGVRRISRVLGTPTKPSAEIQALLGRMTR